MHQSVKSWVRSIIKEKPPGETRVLEVGSLDVNGSVRPIFAPFPVEYIGVDLREGPRVDRIVDACDLVKTFGEESFGVVISTELLEHVKDWRTVISQMKRVLSTEGRLILTTRGPGFPYHGEPFDYWRYRLTDFEAIFSDFRIRDLREDPQVPGVFMDAEKPCPWLERPLDQYTIPEAPQRPSP